MCHEKLHQVLHSVTLMNWPQHHIAMHYIENNMLLFPQSDATSQTEQHLIDPPAGVGEQVGRLGWSSW